MIEIFTIYKKYVHVASVKSKIMNLLYDKEFVKSNMFHFGASN